MKRIEWLKKELKESEILWSKYSCDCLHYYIEWLKKEIIKYEH